MLERFYFALKWSIVMSISHNDVLLIKIKRKRAELEKVARKLKRDFVGLDSIIDKIIKNIEMWYIFPEMLSRPVILNLWGLTGVGKTDLVRKLSKYLDKSNEFVEVQLLSGDSNSYMDTSIKSIMNEADVDTHTHGILLLDEIQRFRTINEHGEDIRDSSFQDIWMLLSDGKFPNDNNSKQKLLRMILQDKYDEDHKNDVDDEDAEDEFEYEYDPKSSPRLTITGIKGKEKEAVVDEPVVPVNHKYKQTFWRASEIKTLLKRPESLETIMKWTSNKCMLMVHQSLQDKNLYSEDDFSKMLIIISGNLDEAYTMSRETSDTDIDADIYHSHSLRINFKTIKEVLKSRFKPEQIARFGNNHIVYPSLSKDTYYKIIDMRINEIKKKIKKKTGKKLSVSKKVKLYIYRNGVFPSQGTRPLFSTISSDFESILSQSILEAIEQKSETISVDYKDDSYLVTFKNKTFIKIKSIGQVDKIKTVINKEEQVATSCHEAGHAVVTALIYKKAPRQIISRTTSMKALGFIFLPEIHYTKENYLNDITIAVAGKISEIMIFGKDKLSGGISSDMENATIIASRMVKVLSMFEFSSVTFDNMVGIDNIEHYNYSKFENNEIENIVVEEEIKAEKLLRDNKKFLTDTIDALIANGKILPEEFVQIAKKNGVDISVTHEDDIIIDKFGQIYDKFKD